MNERIKELERQAEKFVMGIPASLDINEYTSVFNEKFAELIVEECCNRLSEETIRHDGYGYNQHELYNRLRKHFGVAE
jgi:predicted nucleotide-binding protein (sugar kinase/HSP70/actin superfamily)